MTFAWSLFKALGEGEDKGYYLNPENNKHVYLYVKTAEQEEMVSTTRQHGGTTVRGVAMASCALALPQLAVG